MTGNRIQSLFELVKHHIFMKNISQFRPQQLSLKGLRNYNNHNFILNRKMHAVYSEKVQASHGPRNINIPTAFNSMERKKQIQEQNGRGLSSQQADKKRKSTQSHYTERSTSRNKSRNKEPSSPVSQFLQAADDKFEGRKRKTTITVKRGTEKFQVINWTETELFDYFSTNETKLDIKAGKQIVTKIWDEAFYSDQQIESLITKMKERYSDFSQEQVFAPIYLKALLTLKFLLMEQAIEPIRFNKIRQMYSEITQDNSLKLLLRSQIMYQSRLALLDVFQTKMKFEKYTLLLFDKIKEVWQKKNDETGSENADIFEANKLMIQVEKHAQELLDKHQRIFFERRFKFLRNKEIYFKNQNVVKNTFKVVKQLNNELNECFPEEELKINVTLEENPVHVETFDIQEVDEEKLSNNQSSLVSQQQQDVSFTNPKEPVDELITNEPIDISEFQNQIAPHNPRQQPIPVNQMFEEVKTPALNLNNLSKEQINKLLHLQIITSEEATPAIQKLSIKQRVKKLSLNDPHLNRLKKKRRAAKSVIPGRPIQQDGIMPSHRIRINHRTNYNGRNWPEPYTPFGVNTISPRNAGTAIQYSNVRVAKDLKQKYRGATAGQPLEIENSARDTVALDMNMTPNSAKGISDQIDNFSVAKTAKSSIGDHKKIKQRRNKNFVQRLQSQDASSYAPPLSNPFTPKQEETEHSSNIHIDNTGFQRLTIPDGQSEDVETGLQQALRESALAKGRQTGQSTSTEHELEAQQQDNKLNQEIDLAKDIDIDARNLFEKRRTTVQNTENQANPNLKLFDDDKVFQTFQNNNMKSKGAPGQKANKVRLKKLKYQSLNRNTSSRAQTVNNAFVPDLNVPLKDGRRNGFFNLNLIPPLDRERSQKIPFGLQFKTRKSAAPKDNKSTLTHHSMNINEVSDLGTSRLDNTSQKQDNSYVQYAQKSYMRDLPFEQKIQQLHQRLNNLGLDIPDNQKNQISQVMDKLDTDRSGRFSLTESILKSARTNDQTGMYVPAYGGHTKSSLIRAEIQNYQGLRQIENNLNSREIQELDDLKQPSIQSRQEQHARVDSKFNKIPQTQQHKRPVQNASQHASMVNTRNMFAEAISEAKNPQMTDRTYKPTVSQRGIIGQPRNIKSVVSYTQANPSNGGSPRLHKKSAVDSMYQGNNIQVNFTSGFTNVWGNTNEWMYKDTRMSASQAPEPSERTVLLTLERQLQKVERIKNKQVKEKMKTFYIERYGVQASDQDQFFLSPDRLRDKLIYKSEVQKHNDAASKIQNWWRTKMNRERLFKSIRRYTRAVRTIQRRFLFWKLRILDPKTILALQGIATVFIQRVLRGYQVRRKHMYEIMNYRAELMADPWKRIDIIARGHFQRRVRRAWLDYKWRKAEKKRKKAERLAKSKGKKKKKKKKPALPPGTSIDMADGMTNINLANTGDGEIPEAGEDGEDGEGDDAEKPEGEEGEEGDKGPKLTAEQSEQLKKAFEEKYPDSEGLVTKEDLTPLLQSLGEDMTEELIEELMRSAEEDEETQKVTFEDFLKAISLAQQEEGEKPEGEQGSDKNNSENAEEKKDPKQKPDGEENQEKQAEAAQKEATGGEENLEKQETIDKEGQGETIENKIENQDSEQQVTTFVEEGVKFAGQPDLSNIGTEKDKDKETVKEVQEEEDKEITNDQKEAQNIKVEDQEDETQQQNNIEQQIQETKLYKDLSLEKIQKVDASQERKIVEEGTNTQNSDLQPIVDGVQLNIEIDLDKKQTENVVQRATTPESDVRAKAPQEPLPVPQQDDLNGNTETDFWEKKAYEQAERQGDDFVEQVQKMQEMAAQQQQEKKIENQPNEATKQQDTLDGQQVFLTPQQQDLIDHSQDQKQSLIQPDTNRDQIHPDTQGQPQIYNSNSAPEEDQKTEKVFSKDSFEQIQSPSKQFDSQKLIENKNLDGLNINFDSEQSKKELNVVGEEAGVLENGASGGVMGDSTTEKVENVSQNIKQGSSFVQEQNHLDQGSSLAVHSVEKQVSVNELANIKEDDGAKGITKSAGSFEAKKNNDITQAVEENEKSDIDKQDNN